MTPEKCQYFILDGSSLFNFYYGGKIVLVQRMFSHFSTRVKWPSITSGNHVINFHFCRLIMIKALKKKECVKKVFNFACFSNSYSEICMLVSIVTVNSVFLECGQTKLLFFDFRCVEDHEKPFALGIQWVFIRLLGKTRLILFF